MRESRTYGSVRGALSNGRPYRDHFNAPPARLAEPLAWVRLESVEGAEGSCFERRQDPTGRPTLSPLRRRGRIFVLHGFQKVREAGEA